MTDTLLCRDCLTPHPVTPEQVQAWRSGDTTVPMPVCPVCAQEKPHAVPL